MEYFTGIKYISKSFSKIWEISPGLTLSEKKIPIYIS